MNLIKFAILFVLSIITNGIQAQDYHNSNIDVLNYTFQIAINDQIDVIIGESDNQFILLDTTQNIQFDLYKKDTTGTGMSVTSVMCNGIKIDFIHEGEHININRLPNWSIGDTIEINIKYQGEPKDGLIISKNKFGDRTFFGDNWPNRAHHYLPLKDHPSDKASVSFKITAPHHYDVIANGKLTSKTRRDDLNTITYWKNKVPLPTKVMVFAAADFSIKNYDHKGCTPVSAWVFHQNQTEGFHDYKTAVEVLEYFNSKIGMYPYTKLANVQSKTRYGGMENASCIFYYENSVTGHGTVDDLIAHEIAHQWFGNSVSEKDWPHIWVSEGFATYLADLFMKEKYGQEKFDTRIQSEKLKALSFAKKYPSPIIANNITDLNQLLSPNSYQRAAWVLYMFHQQVGDKEFWATLQTYYHQFQNGNAETKDFISIAEQVTEKPLSNFFMQWLNRADYPLIEISSVQKDNEIELTFTQQQDGPAFELSLPIKIEDELSNISIKKKITTYTIQNVTNIKQIDFTGLDNVFCEWKIVE